ncbi:MAG: nucleotidyltransferase domain-containing protein [Deltaproteobacteria bacterium]|nr:nucleotidyltransferase domain-containing protein [Deltaproteobacteria bacterium]
MTLDSPPPPLPPPPALRRAVARLCVEHGVRALYAFGSREPQAWRLLGGARARGSSDLDLGVLWLAPRAPRGFEVCAKLEDGLCSRLRGVRLDLVELDRAGTFLKSAALKGERLYAADDRELDAYEELIWAMEGDLLPIHRETLRELVDLIRVEAGR